MGIAWADKAYANNSAHQSVICSNAGSCDYSTGSCKCFTGFSGTACQKCTYIDILMVICEGDCSFTYVYCLFFYFSKLSKRL